MMHQVGGARETWLEGYSIVAQLSKHCWSNKRPRSVRSDDVDHQVYGEMMWASQQWVVVELVVPVAEPGCCAATKPERVVNSNSRVYACRPCPQCVTFALQALMSTAALASGSSVLHHSHCTSCVLLPAPGTRPCPLGQFRQGRHAAWPVAAFEKCSGGHAVHSGKASQIMSRVHVFSPSEFVLA